MLWPAAFLLRMARQAQLSALLISTGANEVYTLGRANLNQKPRPSAHSLSTVTSFSNIDLPKTKHLNIGQVDASHLAVVGASPVT